jgi:hypothetical protein
MFTTVVNVWIRGGKLHAPHDALNLKHETLLSNAI